MKSPALFKGRLLWNSEKTLTNFKNLLLRNHWANYKKNLTQIIFGRKEFKYVLMKGPRFFKGRLLGNSENTMTNFKLFFSRTSWAASTKLSTNHLWVKGIQVCSNERPLFFPRGYNWEIIKILWQMYSLIWTCFSGERCGP